MQLKWSSTRLSAGLSGGNSQHRTIAGGDQRLTCGPGTAPSRRRRQEDKCHLSKWTLAGDRHQRPAVQTWGKVTNPAENPRRLARTDSPALLRGASSPFQQVQSQKHPGSNGGVLPRHILTERRHDSAAPPLRRTRACWEFCGLATVVFSSSASFPRRFTMSPSSGHRGRSHST